MARLLALVRVVSTVSVLALTLSACSGGQGDRVGTNPASSPSAAPSGSVTPSSDPQLVTQHGMIVDFDSNQPIAGATVTANDATAVTDAKGVYDLKVHKDEAFEMNVTSDGYVKLVEQETTLSVDYDRGKTTIVPMGLANLLHNTLQGYDATLGVLSVAVLPTGGCKSEGGAKIDVTPKGVAKIRYFASKLPSNSETVVAGEFPSAVIYNLQPGVAITVTVESPSCTQAAFPIVSNGITYLATVSTEAGDVTSFQRLFLQ